jgi:hypothetical protein
MPPQISPVPWHDWYHIICNTYGTWLPGDPRGFRTRHHREHVDGDYKRPPAAGTHDTRWQQAKSMLRRDPIHLDMHQRTVAVTEFVAALQRWNQPLRIIAVGSIHVHALVKVIDHRPRHWIGLAKKTSSAHMIRAGLAPAGGLWAVRCSCKPIADREHAQRVVRYIRDHVDEGAVVWESIQSTTDIVASVAKRPGC